MLPEGSSRRSRASTAPTAPRSASSATARPAPRSSSARSTTSARAPPGRRCRTRTSRSGSPRRRPAPPGGARMSVTAARGFVAAASRRDPRQDRKDLAVVRSLEPAVGAGDVHRATTSRRLASIVREHLALAEPQAVVIELRRRQRRHRRARQARRARDRGRGRAAARPDRRGGARPLDGRDRRAAAAAQAAPRRSSRRSRRSRRDGGADAAEAIMTTDTCAKEAVVAGTASRSAAWRRARG